MISQEEIKSFLEGSDPEKFIVSVEYDYITEKIIKIKQDPIRGLITQSDSFTPFAWVGDISKIGFYDDDKDKQKEAKSKHGIVLKSLKTNGNDRLKKGHRYLVESTKGYRSLISFFKEGGIDPWGDKHKELFIILTPVEQYLMQKGKRLFKGFEEYNDVTRFVFDLETTSLDPKEGSIFMIGMKTNKGFKKVIECSNEKEEALAIIEFFKTIDELKPSIIGGYNSANFDWYWIFERCKILGINVKDICLTLNNNYNIRQREGILKLGNEVEKYNQVELWGYNVIDIIHSVRRAQAINSNIKSAGLKYITKFIDAEAKDRVYIDHLDIGKLYKQKEEYWLNIENGNYRKVGLDPKIDKICEKRSDIYIKTTGDNLVERYLDDDLEETLKVDEEFNQGSFLLAGLVPTTYTRISTMGTAALWKMLMLAWSYENDLAIPKKQPMREFVGGLSRLLKVGYSKDVLKLDFSSLYPSIQLVHDIFPDCDVMGVMKSMLKYFRDTRILYKNLASEYESIDAKKSLSYDRKQLPIKIFINSLFGSLSAPNVFPWADMDNGEQITCTGRQYLRQMIRFFMKKGYVPLVMDTDGVNFAKPLDWESRRYVGKGLNWKVKEGKEYFGDNADVAEFNDLFMRGEMALDTDGTWPSCINLSRKNYAVMDAKGKIKLTGNSIKSKKLPVYIEDFLDKGIKMLLEGKGYDFVEWYYQYLEEIYNKKIPLAKIAQRAKVKLTIEDYIKRSKETTKAGNSMSRMAHMELAIKHGIKVNLGDVIYYVNNGTKASEGDVQKVNKPKNGWLKKGKKSYEEKATILRENGWETWYNDDNWIMTEWIKQGKKYDMMGRSTDDVYNQLISDKWNEINGFYPDDSVESMIRLNCYMLNPSDIENNPDMMGDYNVARAIVTFNKRIEPLLVCFKPEIRDMILVINPENRGLFTNEQCKLVNGYPFEPEDQDELVKDVLNFEDRELVFWEKVGENPNYIYNFAEENWEQHIY
jgi:DNA polymerase elongation subunit (family B)